MFCVTGQEWMISRANVSPPVLPEVSVTPDLFLLDVEHAPSGEPARKLLLLSRAPGDGYLNMLD